MKIFNGYIEKKKKQIPQYLHFRSGLTHLNYSLIMIITKVKKMNGYLMLKMTCSVLLSHARLCKAMEELTGFPMKGCLSAPGLRWKYFISMRDENDEPIYTYNDKDMRWFVRQSIKGGPVCAFNQ